MHVGTYRVKKLSILYILPDVLFIIIQNNQMYNCEDEQNIKRLNNKEHNKKHRRAIKKQERKRIKKLEKNSNK
ncbi:hypothetical protein GQ597_05380 [Gilliamella sp. Pra-s65]|uniref:hypothetical protein n=1 Tax=unclassified Gilliamella TaxID=2685620 RepID=UPI001365A4B4|nr:MULTISPECIES: hypothetical protein [unclassified Gilliamella]MWN90135.1 hypothetical protein [Gilliamella sp. Pra-s65]MWP73182.1 hypothetical protein [Gilliamella sp. Pra-s52]